MSNSGSRLDLTADWFPNSASVSERQLEHFAKLAGSEVLDPRYWPQWISFFDHWARYIVEFQTQFTGPAIISISGSQGSGKTTTSNLLRQTLAQFDTHAVVLSIDDFYLTRNERAKLATTVHPLLAERGMPGTHDLTLLDQALNALQAGECPTLPMFDKGIDDRLPQSQWRRLTQPADIVLLEGWCLGCPPQSAAQLREPLNQREQREDGDRRWRTFVNEQLAGPYRQLFALFDQLHLLRAPSFEQVFDWRDQQEQANRDRSAALAMTTEQVHHYVTLFERWTKHILNTVPEVADLVIALDQHHLVQSVQRPAKTD